MGLLLNRRREMGGEALPYDARIEYIGATGTQYIDTLYKPSKNSEFDIQFYWTASVSGESDGTQQCLFGLYDGGTWANVMGNYSSSELYWAACGNVGAGLVRNQVCNVSLKGNVITRPDGATYTVSKTYSAVNRNLYLLCRNQNGPTRYCNGARIYYAKFWENGTLVRDFIPVRVGLVGYLYDKVSRQLFGNAGSGSFTLGQDMDYQEIEYLLSSGTQWIDTNVVPSSGLVTEIDFQYVSLNNNTALFGAWDNIGYHCTLYNSRWYYCSLSGESNVAWRSSPPNTNRHKIKIDGHGGIYEDDVKIATTSESSATMNNSIVIFARKRDGTVQTQSSIKCYGLKMYSSNGTLIRDFIPVRIGQNGYLYDKVTDNFYGNFGSGSFTLGPDV